MAEKEFFKFLIKASQEFGNNKILLDDILQPKAISSMMLLVYLYYVFSKFILLNYITLLLFL